MCFITFPYIYELKNMVSTLLYNMKKLGPL